MQVFASLGNRSEASLGFGARSLGCPALADELVDAEAQVKTNLVVGLLAHALVASRRELKEAFDAGSDLGIGETHRVCSLLSAIQEAR